MIVEPQAPWAFDPISLSLKNSHGVSEDALRKRVFAYEVIKPTYFAWFLSRSDSLKLLKESEEILKQCFEVMFRAIKPSVNLKDNCEQLIFKDIGFHSRFSQ